MSFYRLSCWFTAIEMLFLYNSIVPLIHSCYIFIRYCFLQAIKIYSRKYLIFLQNKGENVSWKEKKAVDWIFRYGNEALAALEKQPLDKMIGSSFSSLFSNMDAKWLHVYERATLYGETLEIMDYSPEIDTNLKIICFPTFPGHCGCILFDADKMRYIKDGNNLVRWIIVSMKKWFC